MDWLTVMAVVLLSPFAIVAGLMSLGLLAAIACALICACVSPFMKDKSTPQHGSGLE